MNEKFTPGPWRIHLDKRNGTVCSIIEDQTGDCVARTVYRYPRGERNANGHLIAAAPEMYNLLQFFCSRKHTPICRNAPDGCSVCKLNKILKKARGEE